MTALAVLNTARYLPCDASLSVEYSLSVITLAMDAIGVPNPPMLDPARSPCQSVVNCDSMTAAGTLLIT